MADYNENLWESVTGVPSKDAGAPVSFDTTKWEPVAKPVAGPLNVPTEPPAPGAVAEKAAAGVIEAVRPHSPTQAAIMALQAVLPFAGELAPAFEESAPLLSKGLTYLSEKGLGPLAARVGLTGAVGGAAGAVGPEGVKEGTKQGLETGLLGEGPAPGMARASGLKTAETAATDQMAQQAADAVARQAVERGLSPTGTTPMTTERAAGLATPTDIGIPSGAAPLAQAKGALGEARNIARREVGVRYEPIYGPIAENSVTPDRLTQIGEAASKAQTWASEHQGGRISPGMQRLLENLQSRGQRLDPLTIRAELDNFSMTGKASTPALTQQLQDRIKAGPVSKDEMLSIIAQQKGPTIGELRGTLGQVMQEANRPGTSNIERRALFDASKPILDTLNDAVPEEQRPLLQQINQQYAQVSRLFPFKNVRAIGSAGTLPQLGKIVFSPGHEAANSMALARMNPEQRDLMRQAFASYVLSEGGTAEEMLSRLENNKAAVNALYPGSDFAKIGTWKEMITNGRTFRNGPSSLPSQQHFMTGVQDAIRQSGLSPEAQQAATDALMQTGKTRMPHILRYATTWGALGAIGGYGILYHQPELIVPLAIYGAGHAGWRALANNPAAMDTYRRFIMGGWTRKGGEALGRLLVGAGNAAIQGTPQAPTPAPTSPEVTQAGM